MQDKFIAGDEVWCIFYGKGEVKKVMEDAASYTFPVHVLFGTEAEVWYTEDGKIYEEGPRTLFFSEPKIEASVTRPFVPALVGKRVVVRQKACHDVMVEVTYEDCGTFGDKLYTFDKCLVEVYEVSSENLLKP